MNWKTNKYGFLLIFYAIIFALIMYGMPRQIDWTMSFSKNHKKPYGCYVLKNELHQLFDANVAISESNEPVYNHLGEPSEFKQTYIAINEDLSAIEGLDSEVLLEFVAAGNEAFLSAENLPQDLLDTLGIGTVITSFGAIEIESPQSFSMTSYHSFQLQVLPTDQWQAQSNLYVTGFNVDSSAFPLTVLGTYTTEPNFVGISIGEGTLFLHSFPLVFTNFNMLKDDKIPDYISACISYLAPEALIWDEYYKVGKMKYAQSPLATLLSYESTRWGIYIGLIGILLCMIFMAKRNQREIPIVEPYANESVAFTNTLGDLYFQNQDHTDLANKKLKFFKDYVFEKYRMHDLQFNSEEKLLLARKSGHEEKFIEGLYKMLRQVQDRTAISSQFLQAFSNKLHFFYHGK